MGRLRVLTVLLATLVAVNVSAQTVTGSLSGTVVDGSGNVVPGASITIVNEATAEERQGVTTDVGDFIFPALVPFCVGYAKIFERLGRSSGKPSWLRQGLRGTGIAVGLSMVVASAVFFARLP